MLIAPRVLVVDDERYVRGLLSELFTVWGCETDVAASGTEGWVPATAVREVR